MIHPQSVNDHELFDWNWLPVNPHKQIAEGHFAGFGDSLWRIPESLNRVVQSLPLICWLGFTEVYLLGADNTKTGYAYDTFADRSFADPERDSMAANVAYEVMTSEGVRLLDLTQDGKLGIPQGRLEDILERNEATIIYQS